LEEKIFHMAGATTPQQQTIAALKHAICEAGREPVQRDSHYRRISHRSDETHATPASAELACA
jgi:aminodeoxyfutalosine synthase